MGAELALKESEFERAENARRNVRKIVERNRLILDELNISERYVNGQLSLYVEVGANIGSFQKYRLLIQRVETLGRGKREGFGCSGGEDGRQRMSQLYAPNGIEGDVFIAPIEVMERPKKVIPSLVRFCVVDKRDRGTKSFLYFSLAGGIFKSVFAPSERKNDSGGSGDPIFLGHADGDQIERRSEIVDSVGNNEAGHRRQFMNAASFYKSFGFIRIEVDRNSVRLSSHVGLDRALHIEDVAVGLSLGPIRSSVMAKTPKDELEETRRLMGALVRQPPNPHDAMKVGRNKRVAESKENDSTVAKKKSGRRP
jgi:hypothetical protein